MGYESGDYLMKITNQGFGKNKTGSDFFFLEGEPVAMLRDGSEFSVQPYPRTIKLTITDKTVKFVIDKLVAIGWPGGRWGTLDPVESGFHDFSGQELQVVCTKEPGVDDSGKLYEKWDLPFGGGEKIESDPSVSRKLDQMFGKSAAAAKKPAARKPPARVTDNTAMANASMTEAANEDDIPF